MLRSLIIGAIAAILALAAAGCDEGDGGGTSTPTQPPSTQAPTAAPIETPAPEPTSEPSFTDLARIILRVARDNRVDLVEELGRFSPIPCTTSVEGIGGPPQCREGEANGTPVNVMLAAGCEGYYVREGELPFETFALVGTNGSPLYGIYRVTSSNIVQGWPGATYVVVLRQQMPGGSEGVLALLTDEVSIIGFMQGCGETPQQWVATQGLTDVVIEPGAAEQASPTP